MATYSCRPLTNWASASLPAVDMLLRWVEMQLLVGAIERAMKRDVARRKCLMAPVKQHFCRLDGPPNGGIRIPRMSCNSSAYR